MSFLLTNHNADEFFVAASIIGNFLKPKGKFRLCKTYKNQDLFSTPMPDVLLITVLTKDFFANIIKMR